MEKNNDALFTKKSNCLENLMDFPESILNIVTLFENLIEKNEKRAELWCILSNFLRF